jgi:hypothetical protein
MSSYWYIVITVLVFVGPNFGVCVGFDVDVFFLKFCVVSPSLLYTETYSTKHSEASVSVICSTALCFSHSVPKRLHI